MWLIGACGRVGSAVAMGLAALRKRRIASTGLVTALEPLSEGPLPAVDRIVLGGHEIRRQALLEAVREAHADAGVFERGLVEACGPELRAVQRDIRPGTLRGCTERVRGLCDSPSLPRDRAPAAAIERLSSDIRTFQKRHRLDRVVVVHVASAEPPLAKSAAHGSYRKLDRALASSTGDVVPASSLYALAALEAGCAYVNFTSAPGVKVPAVRERADRLGLPYMGSDGKTGETLVKSVLAPMFAMRHLKVLSWVGQNILGNRDGAILTQPDVRAGKVAAKDRTVSSILSGQPRTGVSINYVPSLDDWKVAWDYIHFEGFLGTKMSLQFTWQGCDSMLAAPLVIDLARLSALELSRGAAGPMRHLAFFFKDPIEADKLDLFSQWEALVGHVAGAPGPGIG